MAEQDIFAIIDGMIAAEQDGRTKRQLIGVRKWVANKATGTLEWATGVGKTRAATTAIQLLRRSNNSRKVIIVVPRIPLKQQWERGLEALGLRDNTEVWVINSLIKQPSVSGCLLILDEVHRYAAKTFAKVFSVVKYEYVLGLTATLKRLDGKHKILAKVAPIMDVITMVEALRNGYVSPYREYNLGIEMTVEKREEYREIITMYGYLSDKFNGDFALITACICGLKPRLVGNEYVDPPAVAYARRMGWLGNSAYRAFQIHLSNQDKPRREHTPVWGNDEHPYSPRRLYIWALNALRYNRKIREFVYGYFEKVDVAEKILAAMPGKAISFGEIIAPAEELKARVGDSVVVYHSKMKASARKSALSRIENDDSIRAILTARALDEGVDLPATQLGLVLSRSSSSTQYVQRLGRVVRRHVFDDGSLKVAIIINIYVKDTMDYNWLRRAQKPLAGRQRFINSVEELLDAEARIAA